MTIDKQKLKALAEALIKATDDWQEREQDNELGDLWDVADDNFTEACTPSIVLTLLAEIEQLRDAHEQVCTNYNRVSFVAEERGEDRDRLKAENEALRKDAERYRWLRMPWQEQRQVKAWTSLEVMDENIDAAMAREAIDE